MPGFDGTGPRGLGPMTGGGFGYCAGGPASPYGGTGYYAPGYTPGYTPGYAPGWGTGWGTGWGVGRGGRPWGGGRGWALGGGRRGFGRRFFGPSFGRGRRFW